MARRRRRSPQKAMMPRRGYRCHWWHMCVGALGSMALILFVITVWPAAMALVHSIHWGWFLAAAVVLKALYFMKCKCWKR